MNSILKNRALLLLLTGFVALGLAACGEEDENGITPTEPPAGTACTAETVLDVCGGYACNIAAGADEGVCFETCADDAQCVEGFECAEMEGHDNGEEGTTAAPMMACVEAGEPTEPPAPFIYIGVASTTDAPEGPTPGPNVDAIEIVRGGESVFAQSVAANLFVQGPGNAEPGANSADSALGPAQNRDNFTGNQACSLDVSDNTYSLGATGGYIVVTFGPDFALQSGDVVRVWETSNPPCTNAPQRTPGDTYTIYAGQADALDARFDGEGWLQVGDVDAPSAIPFTLTLP